jgi:ubiquinone/menaquinone biosynthesis C-methylase UbiE/transcriptional regulator with XRE-family HTH domain
MEKKKTPALTQSLGERIAICAERMGGKRAMADICKVSEPQLYRYISGARVPDTDFILLLAQSAKVNATWLLTGEGTMLATSSARPAFRPELLAHLSQLLEESLQEQTYSLTPTQKAKALTFLYEAASFEEAPTGRPAFTSTSEIIAALDYMTAMSPIEESIDIHLLTLQLMEKWDVPPPELYLVSFLERWTTLVAEGQKNVQDHTLGSTMYNMLGYNVAGPSADRLDHMIKTTLDKGSIKEISLLDVGCGNGRELVYIHQRYPFVKLKGIDISGQATRLAQIMESNGKLPKGTVSQANIVELPFQANTFDIINCRFTLGFLPLIESDINIGALKAIQEMLRVLKPGGRMELVLPAGKYRSYLPFRRTYSRLDFEKIETLLPDFKIAEWEEPPVASFTYRFEEMFTHRHIAIIYKK